MKDFLMKDFRTLPEEVHQSVLTLADELLSLKENQPTRPTQADRDALMGLRRRIKEVINTPPSDFTEADHMGIRYLLVIATLVASNQEEFYTVNGNSWAEPQKQPA